MLILGDKFHFVNFMLIVGFKFYLVKFMLIIHHSWVLNFTVPILLILCWSWVINFTLDLFQIYYWNVTLKALLLLVGLVKKKQVPVLLHGVIKSFITTFIVKFSNDVPTVRMSERLPYCVCVYECSLVNSKRKPVKYRSVYFMVISQSILKRKINLTKYLVGDFHILFPSFSLSKWMGLKL